MSKSKLLLLALGCGILVAALPELLPAGGPSTTLNAAGLLESGRIWVGLSVILFGGLLTALTPCVYPLIPITVGVFGARTAENRGKALLLTSSYVVGIGLVFSALGVLAAKSGQAFGSLLGNRWVASGLALFLMTLAASMFGAFELNLPSGLAKRVNNVGGAGVMGAFLMGSVCGLLTAPCTGPVLTGLLAFVAKSQNTALGGVLLFVYALGIGIPFFLIGTFAIRLPKSGPWMEWVKSVLGVALLALAVSYLVDAFPSARGVIARTAALLGNHPGALVAGSLVSTGVLLGALHRSFGDGARTSALKAVAVAVTVLALLLRIGALNAPAAGELWVKWGLQKPPASTDFVWQLRVPSQQGFPHLEEALSRARAENRPVLIDFYADWCTACKELDRFTYVAPEVVAESRRFVTIKVDGTNEQEALSNLYQRFGVQGLPTVAFVSGRGELLQSPRVTGFLEPAPFLAQLKKVR